MSSKLNKNRHRVRFASLLMLWCAFSSSADAQISLDRFFPPVVAAGAETAVTAEGKFAIWPPTVDCDRSDVSITAENESGKLTVKVADDALPGVAWIRLYDDQSATSLVPLILSPVDVLTEAEPNDKRSQANLVSAPAVVAGRLAKRGDSDAYGVSIQAGQRLVVSVTANQVIKSPMDAVLQLTDLRGHVLAQSDDVRGLDPQIVYTADVDQDLLIRIFAFPETPNSTVDFAGAAEFAYLLDVTTGPFVDHVASDGESIVPFGYNLDSQAVAATVSSDGKHASTISPPVATVPGALGWSWVAPIDAGINAVLPGDVFDGNVPAILFGHFTKPGETHHYEWKATGGTKYRAEVRSKADGFLLDSQLTITDRASGKTIASNDDISRGRYDAGVDFVAADDGLIDVALSELLDGFGPRHFYQLSIYPAQPRCRLSISADHFVLSKNKPLEITVAVNRVSGFDGKVEIAAVDLPQGVTAEPVISESKGDTSKSVKLKLIAGDDAQGHGTFRIVGTVLDSDGESSGQTIDARFTLRPSILTTEFWLTVPPASTDKSSP